jgi:hypothetical protein
MGYGQTNPLEWSAYMEDELEHAESQVPASPIVDPGAFGRRLRSARVLAGFDRVVDLVGELRRLTGLSVAAPTIWAIERGEQLPSFEQVIAFVAVIKPEGGFNYFVPAIKGDVAALYLKAHEHE